eukprot:2119503-Pleurochrysis_carterae.AAC.1
MKKYISRQLRKIVETYQVMQQGSTMQLNFLNTQQLVQVDFYAPPQQAHSSGASSSNAAGTAA